jgi:hypothetical protein
MANDNEQIGCRAGRAKIIDPNDFNGFNSASNVPVQLEDLTISVILTTTRKARTNLTTTASGSNFESQKELKVNFIEGSGNGDKKVLTTKYTDLTTSFDTGVLNEETLGITNIDIEFNSSMAPMVTVSFIDLRGSSVFQNEETILGGYNKYSVFFQLPYPLFELEIKGYYGRPVKYCLHMLKFNSKFNSQTGNFEITANFIGYSYAMLSDTLLGYLKAIPYTKIGAERYTAYNSTRNQPILNLNELMKSIKDINKDLKKVSEEDPASQEYNATNTALVKLENIKATMDAFAAQFDTLNIDKENHDYIVFKTMDLTTKKDIIEQYKKDVTDLIDGEEGFNKLSESDKFEVANFTSLETNTLQYGSKLYKEITLKMLESTTDTTLTTKLGSQLNADGKKQALAEYLKKNYKVGPDEKLDIFDFSLQYESYKKKKVKTEQAQESSKRKLAEQFQLAVRDRLGFEPTVREIMEIFTAAVEVFIESIYTVSEQASKNTERTTELAKKFTAGAKNSDINDDALKSNLFYPWPDYREKDEEKKTYVEKYLGSSGVLESPEKVDELVFIEDLLRAFRKAKQEENAVIESSDAIESWVASNPMDSIAFGETNPYDRIDIKSREDVILLMVIRAMTFLGYSNKPEILKPEEIQAVGVAEAEAALKAVSKKDNASGVIKQSLTKSTLEFIKTIEGTINSKKRPVIKEVGDNYEYSYIYLNQDNVKNFRLIPLNKGFKDESWGQPKNETDSDLYENLRSKRNNEEYLFLTNYTGDYGNNAPISKEDDGGIYVDLLKSLPTSDGIAGLPEGVTPDNVLVFDELKKDNPTTAAGFNTFGGNYGAQDFSTMNWGNAAPEGLQLMYVFYDDYTTDKNVLNFGLSKTRKDSNSDSKYDFKESGNSIVPKQSEINKLLKSKDGKSPLRKDLGKNRTLIYSWDDSVSFPYVGFGYNGKNNHMSLFGSELYYMQSLVGRFDKYNKALLFLHSLPFNRGVGDKSKYDIFEPNEIRSLFDLKAGFIHAPRLWCAYLGGLLWRISSENPIYDDDNKTLIGGGSGNLNPIAWNMKYDSQNQDWDFNISDRDDSLQVCKKDEHLPRFLITNGNSGGLDYNKIDLQFAIWPNIPQQAKIKFKKAFFDFVNGGDGFTSFDEIRNELEIYEGTGPEFRTYLTKIQNQYIKNKDTNSPYISADDLLSSSNISAEKKAKIKENYSIITPIIDNNTNDSNGFNSFLFLEIKDGSTGANILKKALTEEIIIVNNTYKIWEGYNASGGQRRSPITTSKTNFELYFNSVVDTLKKKGDEFSPTKEQQNLDTEIFGTANKDIIRLQLYRTCKNIYDKWLGGADDINKVMYQCGSRGSIDSKLAAKYGNKATKFIDSFRFVTRAFRDIGDELYINPLPINNFLIGNPDTSAYDAMSSLLAENNFEFQPLPNFINFNDDETLTDIFKPFSYYDPRIEDGICGPSFVCVYVGQVSKHLDFRGGEYPNDGFDLRCINSNGTVSLSPDVPPDFTSDLSDYEDAVGAFTVRYSQQNQNIFKDIQLDQSEFSETDESLQIQDEISQKGAENNRSFVGQNIYNVYAVRSYSAQIDMMGNAMIQPMMYFQLDNIPMFHGAYMITKVKHSIKPNSMSTNFTGVRIRYPETPLITAYDVYMDLIATLDTSAAGTGTFGGSGGGGGGSIKGTFQPIITTLIENGVSNGYIDFGKTYGQVTTKEIKPGTYYSISSTRKYMIAEAAVSLEKMLNEWGKWMESNGYKKNASGKYINIGSLYRSYSQQSGLASGQKTAAKAGTSLHGWGLAVDMSWVNKKGEMLNFNYKKGSIPADFKFTGDNPRNPAIEWLYNNSYRFGFINPNWARDNSGYDEAWHWEYHGKSAKCLIGKNTSVYGQNFDVSKNYDSVVKNPKTPDGKEAVYTGCESKYIERGDGTNSSKIVEKSGCPSLPTSNGELTPTKDIYTELKKVTGLNDYAVAGIMGNLFRESRFAPQAFNSGGGGCGAYGMVQWRGGRQKALNDLATANKTKIDDYKIQIKFLYKELSETWVYTLNALKNVNTAENAAKIFSKTFEAGNLGTLNFNVNNVINGSYDEKRVKYANEFYKMISTKTFTSLK